MTTFHYVAAVPGESVSFSVAERSESIANVEAKITLEAWLAHNGYTERDLTAFDMTHSHP